MIKGWSDFIAVFFICFLCGCASQGLLTGGEPDEDPPVLVKEKSTPNHQTNFFPEKIELVFDEFVQLKNPIKEIGISPPLNKILKYKAQGKKVIVEFPEEEELRANATYTINFGNAIQDFRENNKLTDFTFVFSTGDKIDSLSVAGVVRDALTGDPIENAVVMLYDNLRDSAVYEEKPFYFDKTDDLGNFIINNIKEDTFAIYALQDENLSYTWDQDSEGIAFIDSSFYLNDSSDLKFDLFLSVPQSEPRMLSAESTATGKVSIATSSKLDVLPEISFSQEIDYQLFQQKDSLLMYYDTTGVKSFQLYMLGDTSKIKPKRKKKKNVENIKFKPNLSNNQIGPKDSLRLLFDLPIIDIDKDKIQLKDTSNVALPFELKIGEDPRQITLQSQRALGINYALILQDSALVSYNKIYNDSLNHSFKYLSTEELGIIHFVKDSTSISDQFVLHLLDGETEIKTLLIEKGQEKISVEDLLPKSYRLKIIDDINGNGKWDAANFEKKIQAEKIMIKELEKLKENWEIEVELGKAIFKTAKKNDPKGR